MVGNILQPSFYVTGAGGVATKGVLTGTITVTGTFAGVSTHKVITGTGTLFKVIMYSNNLSNFIQGGRI